MTTTLPATVAEAMAAARMLGVDRLDAQRLLAHHLGRPRSWLLAHDTDALPAEAAAPVLADLQSRASGVPLAYLTGTREFHGLDLHVTPDVLDPRPDTEILVDWALELLAGELAVVEKPQVVDLGTGSGAIALAVKQGCPRASVRALDASTAALAVARANGERLGLDAIRAILSGAAAHLEPGGWLLLEHGFDQADAVRRRLSVAGFECIGTRRDLAGHERCSGGRQPPATAAPVR